MEKELIAKIKRRIKRHLKTGNKVHRVECDGNKGTYRLPSGVKLSWRSDKLGRVYLGGFK